MKEFGVYELALRLETLDACCKQLQLADLGVAPYITIDDKFVAIMASVFSGLKIPCENIFADSTLIENIDAISQSFNSGQFDRRAGVLKVQMQLVLDGIHHNLEKRKFMIFSEEEARFHTNPDLFGDTLKDKYSAKAFFDGIQAGNAYAASLYTASVFHCMRVAEYGLRKLASNRNLRITIKKKGRPCPIEYGTWQEVIDAIQSKIRKIRQRPVGPAKEAELQFFSSAADHCEYMKDIWRNELSHTRRSYKKEEALSVINRVKEFVTVVATHKGSVAADDSVMRLLAAEKRPSPPPFNALAALASMAPVPKPIPSGTTLLTS